MGVSTIIVLPSQPTTKLYVRLALPVGQSSFANGNDSVGGRSKFGGSIEYQIKIQAIQSSSGLSAPKKAH